MIRLTQTGWLFLGVAVALYLASLTSQSGLLLMPIGILIGCYVVNFFAARRAVKNIEVHTPESVHLGEGQRMSQPWKLINRSEKPAAFLQANSTAGTLFSLGSLAPEGEAHLVPELVFGRRGVYEYAEVTLSSLQPFGLVKAARRLKLPGEIIVHPALYPTYTPKAAGYDVMVGGKFKGNRKSHAGANFAGVRPLESGDPLKHIHWKSSSKGLGLMVKTFDEELSGRVAVIFDCGSSGSDKVLDDCARAAGSIIFAALDAGHHVEWVDLSSLHHLLVPPFADGQEVLELLARLQPVPGCLTRERLRTAAERVSAKAALCFFLTQVNADALEIIGELRAQGRTVAAYVPEQTGWAEPLSGVPVWAYGEHNLVEQA
ncbi:MAG: DUF58 domain-containing protein [Verrucomicrobiota bacterium]